MSYIDNKRILVTGACGTIGTELVRQLLETSHYRIRELVGLDNNESELFFLDERYLSDKRARFVVSDIRDREAVVSTMRGIDVVFHAAALKHVVLCERSPMEAVQTNIHGVQNIVHGAIVNNVEKVIFTSSDKAVNPTNVMGTSKLMGERLMTAANSTQRGRGTIFASTRFGNVLGSRGSVIPIFHKQIAQGGPVTLTHSDMSRFVMSISDAVRLVIDSADLAKGGEVFITKMPVIMISDLAEVMIGELAPAYDHEASNVRITEIGTKPGEKLYEELMNSEETRRAVELTRYFSILPAFRGLYNTIDYDYPDTVSDHVVNPYISSKEGALSKEDIREFLNTHELLQPPATGVAHPSRRYWPGDKEEGA